MVFSLSRLLLLPLNTYIPEDSKENAEEIINICIDLYKKAAEENKIDDLEMIRSIVNQFGENGYPAVDSRNQIDMT